MLRDYEASGVEHISNEDLLTLDVDVLVPAAMENQITAASRKRCGRALSWRAPTGPPPWKPTRF
jgi:hypothetical protein